MNMEYNDKNMKEDFVTYEQSLLLKGLGFDWECNHYYYEQDKSFHIGFYQNFNDNRDGLEMVNGEIIRTTSVSAPTLFQVQKWLFERRGYFLSVQYNNEKETFQCIIYKKTFTYGYYCTNESYTKEYFQGCEDIISYEPVRCLNKGITKVLELLKEQCNGNKIN